MKVTRTHTFTVIRFADPNKRCAVCGADVEGYVDAPGHGEDGENWPCRHRGYTDLCASWSPVDGCRCDGHPHEDTQEPTEGGER